MTWELLVGPALLAVAAWIAVSIASRAFRGGPSQSLTRAQVDELAAIARRSQAVFTKNRRTS